MIHIVWRRTETNVESDKCYREHNRNAAVDKLIGEDLYGSDRVRHSGREIYRTVFRNKRPADVPIFPGGSQKLPFFEFLHSRRKL